MGVLFYLIFGFGTQLIASAPHSIVTVFDFTNCYAAPPVALPCERVAYRAGALIAALNAWCGLLLMPSRRGSCGTCGARRRPGGSPTTS